MESRRRVKEQQKRVGAMEFRNTHFSYTMGESGVEQFVTTPEPDEIGTDPLPPGQVWAISPGGDGEHPGLFRIEVTVGPGSGVRILNQPAPVPFRESAKIAERNLLVRTPELVGDHFHRDPRQHEFNVQMRAFDSARSGAGVGLPVLLALASALAEKGLRGGLIAIGGLNLGGGMETVPNAVSAAELAAEKGGVHAAGTDLRPESAQRAE